MVPKGAWLSYDNKGYLYSKSTCIFVYMTSVVQALNLTVNYRVHPLIKTILILLYVTKPATSHKVIRNVQMMHATHLCTYRTRRFPSRSIRGEIRRLSSTR